jgi:hypothetical protein
MLALLSASTRPSFTRALRIQSFSLSFIKGSFAGECEILSLGLPVLGDEASDSGFTDIRMGFFAHPRERGSIQTHAAGGRVMRTAVPYQQAPFSVSHPDQSAASHGVFLQMSGFAFLRSSLQQVKNGQEMCRAFWLSAKPSRVR